MSDATFEDGAERAVTLTAADADDLQVVSATVLPITELTWDRGRRRFALLLNRFRWEDREAAEQRGRGYERVQSLLVIDDVLKVASQGIDRSQSDTILSLLAVTFEPGEDGTGKVVLVLAGDGAVAIDVECLNVMLRDVTRPYLAPSGHVPKHGD
jgi:hypothetical protein